jgi:hypothetical protein
MQAMIGAARIVWERLMWTTMLENVQGKDHSVSRLGRFVRNPDPDPLPETVTS